MRRPTYNFEVFDNTGKVMRRCSRACNDMGAHEKTLDLLQSTPGAVAAFGIEAQGRRVHSAYNG